MKKLFLALMLPLAISFVGCGSKEDKTIQVPEGMMLLDLSSQGLMANIVVPDSTKGRIEVIQNAMGAVEIRVGNDFGIAVSEGEGDIALAKSDIAGDEVNKFKRFVVEEPTTLVYETEITQPEFHMYAVIKSGEKSYLIEDIKGEQMFSEKAITKMLESAKTVAPKAVNKES